MQTGHPCIKGVLLLLQVAQTFTQACGTRSKHTGLALGKAVGGRLHACQQTGITGKDTVDVGGIGKCRGIEHFVIDRQQPGLLVGLDAELCERFQLTSACHRVQLSTYSRQH
ncbi:hypothetical protein D3C80_744710 [compost metagenome]